MRWKTTSLIGGTWKGSDACSEPVLMHEGLIYTIEILSFVLAEMILILFSF